MKITSFIYPYFLIGSLLFGQEDMNIHYLKMENEGCKENIAILCNLKSFINDCYAEKAKLLTAVNDWIQDKDLSTTELKPIFEELIEGMKTLSSIPHPNALIVGRKNDLQEISQKFTSSTSKENLHTVFSDLTNQENLGYTVAVIAKDPSSLSILLEKIRENHTQGERVIEYVHALKHLNIEMIGALYQVLQESEKDSILESMLLLFPESKSIRSFITSQLPSEDASLHAALAKKFIESKKDTQLHILLGLLSPSQIAEIQENLKEEGIDYTSALPGRIGSQSTYCANLSKGQIFFYMDANKFHAIRNLVEGVEKDMILSIDGTPKSKVQIVPESIKHPNPISYDHNNTPIYSDTTGKGLLAEYADESLGLIFRLLGYTLRDPQVHLDLVLNQDPLIHPKQTKIGQMFHEYAMVDWQMPDGTISGLIVEDGSLGDRFIMTLFPRDASCLSIVGQNDLRLSYFSPIDYQSTITSGSTKGKNMMIQLCGGISDDHVKALETDTIPLEVNKSVVMVDERLYSNGLSLKKKPQDFRLSSELMRWKDVKENVDIFTFDQKKHVNYAARIADHIGLTNVQLNAMYRLVKRTTGLSQLSKIDLNIPENSTILMINRSIHPKGYDYFNLAEDQTDLGRPWIQLYRCHPDMWIKMDKECFDRLALTPIEEFLFRTTLGENKQENDLKLKIVTEMDVLIFTPLTL